MGAVAATAGIYAGNRAASAQRRAAAEANNRIAASKSEALAKLNSYSQYGRQAFTPLSALLFGTKYDEKTGEFTGNLSDAERLSYFRESPGYQYQLDEGIKAIQRRNAAGGTLMGGNTLKELQTYGQNMADQEYNSYIDSLLGQLGYAQQADTNATNIITNAGNAMANYSYAGGMANAQKYANLSNFAFQTAGQGFGAGLSSMSGGAGGGAAAGGSGGVSPSLMSAMFLSDINLKENIVKVREEKGFNIYEFNYKEKPEKYEGVMAQEVQKIMPEAIAEIDGFLAVDYNKIGIEFKKL